MVDRFKEQQARIDAMFEPQGDPDPVHDRLLEFARRGVDAPESLSLSEIKQLCYALIVHYAQMGIG